VSVFSRVYLEYYSLGRLYALGSTHKVVLPDVEALMEERFAADRSRWATMTKENIGLDLVFRAHVSTIMKLYKINPYPPNAIRGKIRISDIITGSRSLEIVR